MQILISVILAIILWFFMGVFFIRDTITTNSSFFWFLSNKNSSGSIATKADNAPIHVMISSSAVTSEIKEILNSLIKSKNTEEKLTNLRKLSILVLNKDFIKDLYDGQIEEKYLHFWRYLVFTEGDMIRVNKIMSDLNENEMEWIELVVFLKLQSEASGVKFDGKSLMKNLGWPDNILNPDIPGKILVVQDLVNFLPGKIPSRVFYEWTFDQYLNYIIFSLNRALIGKTIKLDIWTGSITYSK